MMLSPLPSPAPQEADGERVSANGRHGDIPAGSAHFGALGGRGICCRHSTVHFGVPAAPTPQLLSEPQLSPRISQAGFWGAQPRTEGAGVQLSECPQASCLESATTRSSSGSKQAALASFD